MQHFVKFSSHSDFSEQQIYTNFFMKRQAGVKFFAFIINFVYNKQDSRTTAEPQQNSHNVSIILLHIILEFSGIQWTFYTVS
jgi:hypothetical protein